MLVQEHMPTHPDHHKWNQPAGWLDVGENPIQAAIRETKEETGLDFKPTALLGIYSLVRKDISTSKGTPHAIKLIFRGQITGGSISTPENEIKQAKWFTPKEIQQMPQNELRDLDIKKEVEDYFKGVAIPLDAITHTTAQPI